MLQELNLQLDPIMQREQFQLEYLPLIFPNSEEDSSIF